jgi:hypothetical protein
MRIFGSKKVTKASASRRTPDVAAAEAVETEPMLPLDAPSTTLVTELAQTDEMPILRESRGERDREGERAYPALVSSIETVESTTGAADDDSGSDVYVRRRSSPNLEEEAAAALAAASVVTLFVYGWESVEPGPLSWAFPSLRAALEAVRTMRNAVEWCIVSGRDWVSVDAARAKGAVLVEQNA